MMNLSPMHMTLFVIPIISAPLSLFSSAFVVYLIYAQRNDRRRSKPREHILLGMSLMDISFSFALSFSTLPGPAVMDEALPTIGTVGTCTAQGFFVQLGLGAPFYNACLCVYYLLRVRYKVSDEYLMKWAVPLMHLIILSFSFGTAIAGIILDLFNYAGVMGCWIHNGDALCIDDPIYCGRGELAGDFEIYFGLIHIVLCFLFVVVSMIFLCCHVRSTEMRSRRWDPSADVSIAVGGTAGGSVSSRKRNSRPLPLTRRTIFNGILFSASFVIIWLPSILLGLASFVDLKHEKYAVRIVRVLAVILQPMQGFFNMLIYTSATWVPYAKKICCCCCSMDEKPDEPTHSNKFSLDYATGSQQVKISAISISEFSNSNEVHGNSNFVEKRRFSGTSTTEEATSMPFTITNINTSSGAATGGQQTHQLQEQQQEQQQQQHYTEARDQRKLLQPSIKEEPSESSLMIYDGGIKNIVDSEIDINDWNHPRKVAGTVSSGDSSSTSSAYICDFSASITRLDLDIQQTDKNVEMGSSSEAQPEDDNHSTSSTIKELSDMC